MSEQYAPATPPSYDEPLTPQYQMDDDEQAHYYEPLPTPAIPPAPEYYAISRQPGDYPLFCFMNENNYLKCRERALVNIHTNVSICRYRRKSLTNTIELRVEYNYWKKQLTLLNRKNGIEDPPLTGSFNINFTPIE
jgi:hypothetical protein